MKLNLNYFLPSWTGNLGVVPLFLFWAFLLAPIFFFLLARLVSVTFVLETIILLQQLKAHVSVFIKRQNLPTLPNIVKASSLICLFSSLAWSEVPPRTLVLARGEQKELQIPKLYKYSVGSSEVLSHRYVPTKGQFLIKGKRLGFSDLIIWESSSKKVTYHVYVLSKQHQLKLLRVQEGLERAGLKVELKGNLLIGQGTLHEMSQYQLVRKVKKETPEQVFLDVKLSKTLRNQLIASFYSLMFKQGYIEVSCHDENLTLLCLLPPEALAKADLIKSLKERFEVQFVPIDDSLTNDNFLVKLKMVQLENMDGEELSFGLHQLVGNLDEFFTQDFHSILGRNDVVLANHRVNMSLLAEPEMILRPNTPALIELGTELPFQTSQGVSGTVVPQTQWKFAGLRLQLVLKKQGTVFHIEYETELTHPGEGSVSGAKQKSSVQVIPGEAIQLFQVGHQANGKKVTSFPLLGEIPWIGGFFQFKSEQERYLKMAVLLTLTSTGGKL